MQDVLSEDGFSSLSAAAFQDATIHPRVSLLVSHDLSFSRVALVSSMIVLRYRAAPTEKSSCWFNHLWKNFYSFIYL